MKLLYKIFTSCTFIFITTLVLVFIVQINKINAQNIAITDDGGYQADSSAMLDVKSSNKGMLVPRVTSMQRNMINNPATGLLVFDIDQGSFFFYNGSEWLNLSANNPDGIWGNSGSDVYLQDDNNKLGIGTNTPVGKVEIREDNLSSPEDPIFIVINNSGDTVFAVYPEGVRVNVSDDAVKAASSRSGFAVGGFSLTKGVTNEYLRVTPDSVRIYVDEADPSKAAASKGGFAVGGFSLTKGVTDEYLRVTDDSVRIYIKDTATSKVPSDRGGFAVGGINQAKSASDSAFYFFVDRIGAQVPFLTEAERNAIPAPDLSSIIFNTTDSCLQIYLGYWENIWCTSLNCTYPTIVNSPDHVAINTGEDATFVVQATGSKLNYQWQSSPDGGQTWYVLDEEGTSPAYSGVRDDTLQVTNIPSGNYRVRCVVINGCGAEKSEIAYLTAFTCGVQLLDLRDDRFYNTTEIGTQCWMAENLDYSAGGTPYENVEQNAVDYGRLYTFAVAPTVCPAGWHLPTFAEFQTLIDALGGSFVAGGALKEAGTVHWIAPNTGATNSSGFTGLPGGWWNSTLGAFQDLGISGYYWSSEVYNPSSGNMLFLEYFNEAAMIDYSKMESKFSIRCLKD